MNRNRCAARALAAIVAGTCLPFSVASAAPGEPNRPFDQRATIASDWSDFVMRLLRHFFAPGAEDGGELPTMAVGSPGVALLSLEVSDTCQGDWDSNAGNGYQVAVQLWMRNLPSNVTGFQAFLLYDDSVMTYNGFLSSYTTNPFPLHITPITAADVGGGSLLLDGSDSFGDPGVSNDALLATLVFDVTRNAR